MRKVNEAYRDILLNAKIDYMPGSASFINETRVVVKQSNGTQRKISSKNILIAVGSCPRLPELQRAELGITSHGFFNLYQQPKKVAVVGEGYIVVELAGTLHTLGTETHMFVRQDRFLKTFDPNIQDTLLAEYKRQGIQIHNRSNVTKLEELSQG